MTPRTQRRAAERKSRKAEQKKLRHLAAAAAAALKAANSTVQNQSPETVVNIALNSPEAVISASAAISEAQLAANRANAQLSTGPTTDLGKSISARNNFRHGLTQVEGEPILLDSESSEDYARLLSAYQREWQPATPTECDLVDRLVTHSWLRRRALGLQKLFLSQEEGLILDQKQFNLYRRYEVQHERAFNKALSDLMRLRSLRIREKNGFESQRRKQEKHEYQMRHLKHREKLQHIAELTAEARLARAKSKLSPANKLTDTYQIVSETPESIDSVSA